MISLRWRGVRLRARILSGENANSGALTPLQVAARRGDDVQQFFSISCSRHMSRVLSGRILTPLSKVPQRSETKGRTHGVQSERTFNRVRKNNEVYRSPSFRNC